MKLRPSPSRCLIAAAAASLFGHAAHAAPTIGIGNADAIEGVPGNVVTVRVPFTLSEAASADVVIQYRTSPRSAAAGEDFRSKSGTVTIPAGKKVGSTLVRIKSDDVPEPTEAFRVSIQEFSSDDASVVLGTSRRNVTIFDDDIPAGALRGSVGEGDGVEKVEATAEDPFNLTDFLDAAGFRNLTSLGGPDPANTALDANGRPTTGNFARLRRGTFDPPNQWPPATATDATRLPVADLVKTNYSGAFEPGVPRVRQWDQGWTVGVNGNADVWRFFGDEKDTALSGASAPSADGTCPAGTTAVGTLSNRFGPLGNDETDLFDGVDGDYDVCQLPRRISSNLKLTNDNVYELKTAFPGTYVGNGEALRSSVPDPVHVNLTIEPGTLIIGGSAEALVVTRGSKIRAQGTSTAPIVFTSETQVQARFDGTLVTPADTNAGEWAGLALTGNARDTTCTGADYANCDRPLEGNVGNYGGPDDEDDSGVLRYVVIRHAGNDIDGNGNELNCLTLGGVGRATRLSNIQCHKGFDDGVELFGGNAFLSNLVLTANRDDSFDYDNGWTGGAQFVYIVQQDSVSPGLGRAIEAGTSIATASPIATFPLLANFTAVGPVNRIEGGAIDDGQAVIFRGGVRGQLWNSVFTGDQPKGCLDFDNDETFGRALEEGGTAADPGRHLFIRNTIFDCDEFSTVVNG